MPPETRPGELRGAIVEGILPGVLRAIYVGRKTGILHFTRGRHRGSVCFIGGGIVYADTTVTECHLGEALVRHGRLKQEDLERATVIVKRTRKRLGQVLVDLGVLDRDGLDDALALHVREVLLCVFAWSDGEFVFEEKEAGFFRGYDKALRLSTGEVILDAVWSVADSDVVRYALGDIGRVLVLTTDPLLRFQQIRLTPTDGFILSRVDGMATARVVLAMAPVSPEEAQRSLFGLLCTGMVEYLPAVPKPQQAPTKALRDDVLEASRDLAGRDHFDVLGLTPAATEADVKGAYHRLARRFHPDVVHREPSVADLRERIEDLFERISAAYKVLSEPGERARYEGSLMVARLGPVPAAEPATPAAAGLPEPPDLVAQAQHGEEALGEAEGSFAQGKYWDAIQRLEGLVSTAQGKTKARARVVLAQCYLKNPRWKKMAEDELLAAIQEDASNADAYYVLGTIYKAGALAGRAAAMFRRTLELKPRHTEAQAELQSLPAEPPSGKPGLLKKIFR